VAFAQVLTMYQIYMNSTPPPLSFIYPSPDSYSRFNSYHTWVHIFCTVFTFLLPFPYTLSHQCQPSPLGGTFSSLLFSDFVEEIREKIK
jgi:hypothetical protein